MSKQFEFPFSKEEEKFKKVVNKNFKGKMPTIEEDEELTILEGGKPTSEEKIRQAKEKAMRDIWESTGKDKG